MVFRKIGLRRKNRYLRIQHVGDLCVNGLGIASREGTATANRARQGNPTAVAESSCAVALVARPILDVLEDVANAVVPVVVA